MGILTDFVIAEAGSGEEIGESIDPSDTWPTFQAKGVDPVKLAHLYCAITGKPYHNNIQESFGLVGGNKEEGPWVFEFPYDILGCFAGLRAEQVQAVSKAWAETEGLVMDGWSPADAASVIQALAGHALKAKESGKSMYLWASL